MERYLIASLTPAKLEIAAGPKLHSRKRDEGRFVESELQFRCLIAVASTAPRTLDSLSRSP
jgi:hypothetical protein